MSIVNGFHKGVVVSAHSIAHSTPASCFNEAFPVGNGRIGGMVYGQSTCETVSLNEDTLWAGTKPVGPNRLAGESIAEIRRLIFEDRIDEAEQLTEATQQVEFVQPYLPAGFIEIDWGGLDDSGYERVLSLKDATVIVDSADVTRTYYASAVDQLIHVDCVVKIKPLARVVVGLGSKLDHQCETRGDVIVLSGRAPESVVWEDVNSESTSSHAVFYGPSSRSFSISLSIQSESADVTIENNAIVLENVRDFKLCVSLATDASGINPSAQTCHDLNEASDCGSLLKHTASHRDLYDQVQLSLKGESCSSGGSAVIDQFMFNYARYLMISASREGTMPANLQGIWNEEVMPPWWSNYTVNINTQMNYWMAEACGLASCHLALINFVESLVEPGTETARVHFGCRGWVLCHQTDFRRTTTPIGFTGSRAVSHSSKWSMWPFGGAWLVLHLYEHYRYHQDLGFLEQRAFPAMLGAALFLVDWFIPDPNNPGFITTAPSTSPENSYIHKSGYRASITSGSAMDISIARSLFSAVSTCAALLGAGERPEVKEIRHSLSLLPSLKVTSDSRIAEFGVEVAGAEDPHRHISQLFSLTPGHDLSEQHYVAARKTLEDKGLSGTGWALAWKSKCWARLGDGSWADACLQALLTPVSARVTSMANEGGGVYPNMLTACPPMQMDANFGFGAAVLDMIFHADEKKVDLLPAVIARWAEGSLTGVRLPGNGKIDIFWSRNSVNGYIVRPKGASLVLSCQGDVRELTFDVDEPVFYEFQLNEQLLFDAGDVV